MWKKTELWDINSQLRERQNLAFYYKAKNQNTWNVNTQFYGRMTELWDIKLKIWILTCVRIVRDKVRGKTRSCERI